MLSAGVLCPNHGWSFDLFTGMSDRGNYRLQTWEVEIRDMKETESTDTKEKSDLSTDQEVWVRRKQRIG